MPKITVKDTKSPIPFELEYDLIAFKPDLVAKDIMEAQQTIFKVIDLLGSREFEKAVHAKKTKHSKAKPTKKQ